MFHIIPKRNKFVRFSNIGRLENNSELHRFILNLFFSTLSLNIKAQKQKDYQWLVSVGAVCEDFIYLYIIYKIAYYTVSVILLEVSTEVIWISTSHHYWFYSLTEFWAHLDWILIKQHFNVCYATFVLFQHGRLIIFIFKISSGQILYFFLMKKMKQYYSVTWTNYIYSKLFIRKHICDFTIVYL